MFTIPVSRMLVATTPVTPPSVSVICTEDWAGRDGTQGQLETKYNTHSLVMNLLDECMLKQACAKIKYPSFRLYLTLLKGCSFLEQ